ncbi:MAG: hypothetical protein LBQ37_04435 [Elusimicrobiota bacterium]|jgi:uncharacterized protein|nr:hypothetical protein [Elusimicrobiota bacterium]
MNNLILKISDFSESKEVCRQENKFHFDIGCGYNINVNIKALKVSEDKIYVSGIIKGFLSLECSRCLFIYKHPVKIDISCDMPFLDGAVDMREEVRQLLILDMPMKPLCDKDCIGICPVCAKRNNKNDHCLCAGKARTEYDDYVKESWENLFRNNRRK